ncbi:MAG: PEGA domain-containing protein [Deltaproteobacteria bacterium]|nr:PEGA domain-containing protein [Deltaproteobacteria bacterium]
MNRMSLSAPRLARASAAALLLFATSASAQSAAEVERAKNLFNAGAQAYSVGNYPFAIQAFDEAFKITPRPAILFSYAQAERRQYFVDHDPKHLRNAVEAFRKYIKEVAQGGRRADAVQALSELEPLLEQQKAAAPAPEPAAPAKLPARVMVTSPTAGAAVALDGAASSEAPFIGEVPPGKHTVVVTAVGHDPERREIQVVEGGLVALDLPLREKPALLTVDAPAGSEVTVDGRLVGIAPIAAVSLPHGRHHVAVTKTGHVAWAREVDVVRGEPKRVEPRLVASTQRVVSYVVLGTSLASFVTGGVFTLVSLSHQSTARGILDERADGNLPPSRLDDYESARDARDRTRTFATIAFGAGAVLGVTGLLLYTLDRPSAPTPELPSSEKAPAPPSKAPMEVSASPLAGPGIVGGSLTIVF